MESVAADWFQPDTYPLLVQYCRHTVAARRVASLVEHAEGGETIDVVEYDRLLKMQEREGRAMSSLAVRMRICQQATTNHRGNKEPKATKKPWQ